MGQPLSRSTPFTLQKFIGVAFVFLSLFPWVSFGTNTLDSQPWALMLALVFLFVSINSPIRTELAPLLLLIPGVMVVGFWDSDTLDFTFYRAAFGYTSVPVLVLGYYAYVRRYGFPLQTVKAANLVYLFVALLQHFLGAAIIGNLAPLRTTPDRGVPSLAAEPTYFGILLLFFSWIVCITSAYRPTRTNLALVIVNVMFLAFIAKSSMAIVFLAFGSLLVVLYRFRLKLYLLFGVNAAAFAVGYSLFLQDTRIGALVRLLQDRGVVGLIVFDASINLRLAHVVIPWYSAVSSGFAPHGFSSFSAAIHTFRSSYGEFFWFAPETNVIMSYAGAFVFELGLIGVLFLSYLFYLVYQPHRLRVFELVFLFMLLNSAIPVAFPIVPLLIVLLYGTPGIASVSARRFRKA